ncbi:MAG: SIMPL domain-containing protein [Clostridia bacterium]|nr:SIMPL domain-containing protein [Clostridia bacterium]
MDKVLRICGKGKIRLRPDTVCAELTLEGVGKEYAEALQAAQEALEKVKGALEKSGFRKEELKTSDFRVETKYEGYRDEKGDWKQKFVGYQYTHALNLRFPADNTLLGEFISAVANSGAEPVFSFSYTVKNIENAKDWLLREAVKDCAKKALILADAAKVELVSIVEIDYSPDDKNFSARPIQPMRLRAAADAAPANLSLDVMPDDIEVVDTVTVVWEIA